jgi:RNA-directed DNA polymerase
MGLELKPSKTRLTHTLEVEAGVPGFDFLGFNIRQYPAKQTRLGFKTIITPSAKARARQRRQIVEVLDRNKSAPQEKLIRELNPVISGWANYFSTVCSKETFGQLDAQLLNQLRAWIRFRSKRKSLKQGYQKYFRREDEVLRFGPKGQRLRLHFHAERPIKRHVKVVGRRSPYEADWVYWSARTGKRPGVTTRVAKLLKQQKGRCRRCGLCFKAGDKLEVDHILPKACGGKDSYANWQLLHRHCHAVKTAADRRRGVRDKHRTIEEPCAAKVASTVLKQRRGERSPRLL